MLIGRVLPLYTALCLLLSLVTVPQGPTLVCRLTGVPVAPVIVATTGDEETASGSCCEVLKASVAPDEPSRYALRAPGCCDLRQSPERAETPAVPVPVVELSVAALASTPSAILPPLVAEAVRAVETPRESAPRPPPLTSAPPRAPPFFS